MGDWGTRRLGDWEIKSWELGDLEIGRFGDWGSKTWALGDPGLFGSSFGYTLDKVKPG